jgi:hypothetical protein
MCITHHALFQLSQESRCTKVALNTANLLILYNAR